MEIPTDQTPNMNMVTRAIEVIRAQELYKESLVKEKSPRPSTSLTPPPKAKALFPTSPAVETHPSWTRLSTPPESVMSVEDATQQLEGYLTEQEREILTQARLRMSAGLNPNQLNFDDH